MAASNTSTDDVRSRLRRRSTDVVYNENEILKIYDEQIRASRRTTTTKRTPASRSSTSKQAGSSQVSTPASNSRRKSATVSTPKATESKSPASLPRRKSVPPAPAAPRPSGRQSLPSSKSSAVKAKAKQPPIPASSQRATPRRPSASAARGAKPANVVKRQSNSTPTPTQTNSSSALKRSRPSSEKKPPAAKRSRKSASTIDSKENAPPAKNDNANPLDDEILKKNRSQLVACQLKFRRHFDRIIEKYSDPGIVSDVVDLHNDEMVENNGHLDSILDHTREGLLEPDEQPNSTLSTSRDVDVPECSLVSTAGLDSLPVDSPAHTVATVAFSLPPSLLNANRAFPLLIDAAVVQQVSTDELTEFDSLDDTRRPLAESQLVVRSSSTAKTVSRRSSSNGIVSASRVLALATKKDVPSLNGKCSLISLTQVESNQADSFHSAKKKNIFIAGKETAMIFGNLIETSTEQEETLIKSGHVQRHLADVFKENQDLLSIVGAPKLQLQDKHSS